MQDMKHMVKTLYFTTEGSWDKGKKKEYPSPTSVRVKARRLYNSYERKYNTEIPSAIKRSLAPVSYYQLQRSIWIIFKSLNFNIPVHNQASSGTGTSNGQ